MSRLHRCFPLFLVACLATAFLSVGFAVRSTNAATPPRIHLSSTSGYVGDNVNVSVSRFAKNKTITVTWDGKTIASLTSSSAGDGSTSFAVPVAFKGEHTVAAKSGGAVASTTYTVKPRLRLSQDTAKVGDTVSLTLRGYAKGESIAIALDSTSHTLLTVTASGSGSASGKIVVPATVGGRHKLIGLGTTGSQSTASLTVVRSVSFSPAHGPAASSIRVAVRGFSKGERVELLWIEPGLSRSLAIVTMSSTGSANVTVTVPDDVDPGQYAIRAFGFSSQEEIVEAPFEVTG